MTQLTFGESPTAGIEGQIANFCEENTTVKQASYDIEYGRKLCYDDVNSAKVSMIGINKIVITNSGDLDASDTFGFTLHIKNLTTGVTTTHAQSATFASSDAATIGTIVTAMELLDGIHADTAYSSNVLTIIAEEGNIIKVTDIAYGAGSTVALTSKVNLDTRVRSGFSRQINKQPMLDSSGNQISRYFKADPAVNVVLEGEMHVYSPTGFDNNDSLYYYGFGDNQGRVANAAGDDTITAAVTDIAHKVTAAATSIGIARIKAA